LPKPAFCIPSPEYLVFLNRYRMLLEKGTG
jgi:hypothetical protein